VRQGFAAESRALLWPPLFVAGIPTTQRFSGTRVEP
jgi:hypothetical protein